MRLAFHPENDPDTHPGHGYAWVAIVAFIIGLLAGEILKTPAGGGSRVGWPDEAAHPRRVAP
jgi:hypothetical protein